MIQKKAYSIRILELVLTSIILTLAVILQEASWLSEALWPAPTSDILVEKINH